MRRILEQAATTCFIGSAVTFVWGLVRWRFGDQSQPFADAVAALAADSWVAMMVAFTLFLLTLVLLTGSGVIGQFFKRGRKR